MRFSVHYYRYVLLLSLIVLFSRHAAVAQADRPAIAELRVAVQDTQTDDPRGFVNPCGVIELREGDRVRLRMVAIPSQEHRAPRYPASQFETTADRGNIRLSKMDVKGGTVILEGVSASSSTLAFEVTEAMTMPKAMHLGTLTVRVVPDVPLDGLAPPDPSRRGVTLFEHSDYTGRAEKLYEDSPQIRLEGAASSVRLDAGCQVTLFAERGYRGRSAQLSADASYLGGTEVGNDQVSSVRLSCPRERRSGVTLFEHQNYRGRSQFYSEDQRALSFQDMASSVKVDSGCEVTLYEHQDFGGRSTVLTVDLQDLEGSRVDNDSVSSLRLNCGRDRGGADAQSGVTLYEHQEFRGRSETFSTDQHSLSFRDVASSVRIARNCRATLFEHPDFYGRSTVVTADIGDLHGSRVGNDTVSSLEVSCEDQERGVMTLFEDQDLRGHSTKRRQ